MYKKLIIGSLIFLTSSATFAAPVSGFVRKLGTMNPVPDATITVIETGEKMIADKDGKFGPFDYPAGKKLTLLFEKKGFRTTQSATVTVPQEGLTSPYNNMTFQALDNFTFLLFSGALGKKVDENKCHVAATVTAYHKTMDDLPQGEEHAIVDLTPATSEKPYYLDIFKSGPFKNLTNPFTHGLTETTLDGGVVYANLEPRDEPYYMSAYKDGVVFNTVEFTCRKGMFINLSPPQGPSVQQ